MLTITIVTNGTESNSTNSTNVITFTAAPSFTTINAQKKSELTCSVLLCEVGFLLQTN